MQEELGVFIGQNDFDIGKKFGQEDFDAKIAYLIANTFFTSLNQWYYSTAKVAEVAAWYLLHAKTHSYEKQSMKNMVIKSSFPDLLIPDTDLLQHVLQAISNYPPNKPALISAFDNDGYNYKELIHAIVNCKELLVRRGVKKYDVVALCCPNIPDFIVCLLATASVGAVVTTCNPVYTPYEITRQFRNCKPILVFTTPDHREKFKSVIEQCKWLRSEDVLFLGKDKTCVSFKTEQLNRPKFPESVQINVKKDIVLLPYSSGTTGLPKGVSLSHENVTSALAISRIGWRLFYHDVEYLFLPIFHIYGLLRSLSTLEQGATLVLDQRFNLDRMGKAIETYKVTVVALVPPILLSISKSNIEETYDLTSLNLFLVGAAPIAPDLLVTVAKKMNCSFFQAWGMTETTGISVILNHMAWKISLTSTGKVCSMNVVKICDIETGKELGPNQRGEIMVKGPEVMVGYYNNPKATSNAFDEEGFLHTGDIGYYDELEQIYVVDRIKELIKYKGFQVAPAEIEHALMSHPKIADAAVIGLPDSKAGEVPKGFIVKKDPTLTLVELNTYLKDKLSKYKQLHGGVSFVDKIPKSPSGKILREKLREYYKSKL